MQIDFVNSSRATSYVYMAGNFGNILAHYVPLKFLVLPLRLRSPNLCVYVCMYVCVRLCVFMCVRSFPTGLL